MTISILLAALALGGSGQSDASLAADLGRLELSPKFGYLAFSEDFESDPQPGASLLLRAPSPWLSRTVMGLDEDDFGVFLELTVSSLDREVDPPFETQKDDVFFVAAGTDYALYRSAGLLALVRLGLQYGSWGDVTETEDGVAVLLGLSGGIEVADGFRISAAPQVALADAGDHVYFFQIGLDVAF